MSDEKEKPDLISKTYVSAPWVPEVAAPKPLILSTELDQLRIEAEQIRKWADSLEKALNDTIKENQQLGRENKQLQEELAEGDYWKKRVTEAFDGGMCPICFATVEVGHKAGCDWGNDLADLELVKEEVDALTRERDESMKQNQRLKTGNQALILDLKELQNRANSLEDDLHRSTKENEQLQQDLAEVKHLHKVQLENAIAEQERSDMLAKDLEQPANELYQRDKDVQEIEKIRLENDGLKKMASYQCAVEWRNLYTECQKKLDRLRELYREFFGMLK